MIESFDDLGLNEIEFVEDIEGPIQPIDYEEARKDYHKRIDARIQEKLGLSFEQLKSQLSDYTVAHAEEIAQEFPNMAPLGDYSKFIEDNDGMADFLKSEAHKPEHWHIEKIKNSDHKAMPKMVIFGFGNNAVDDGSTFKGFIYVSFEGKIKHAFSQAEE